MTSDIPRLRAVAADRDTSLRLLWRDGTETTVDLAGWIASGGDILQPLADPGIFARATLSQHGAGVTWDGDEGDLGIDAVHLARLTAEHGREPRFVATA